MDFGSIIAISWGLATFAFAAIVAWRRYWVWTAHRDRRSVREMLVGVSLVIVAAASFASITVTSLNLGPMGLVHFFGGLAWGTFSAAMLLLALWTPGRK